MIFILLRKLVLNSFDWCLFLKLYGHGNKWLCAKGTGMTLKHRHKHTHTNTFSTHFQPRIISMSINVDVRLYNSEWDNNSITNIGFSVGKTFVNKQME